MDCFYHILTIFSYPIYKAISHRGSEMTKKFTVAYQVKSLVLLSTVLFGLSACASHQSGNPSEIYDPLESTNRFTLKANNMADKAILEPVARGYRAVTPKGVRTVARNFLRNLNSPTIIGNELLQGDLQGAGNATKRAVINTLAGFGGTMDFAAEGGIPYEGEDFGQTLAFWGVKKDMYLMLPLIGPSSARDLTGMVVDGFADPLRIHLNDIDQRHLQYTRLGASIVSEREQLLDIVDDLRRNSFDYYAVIRSAYHQRRQALIADQSADDAAMVNYDEF